MNKRNLYLCMIYFFGALGGLLFGFDTGVISGALLYITQDFNLTPLLEGLVVGGVLIGAVIGAGCCGVLSDRIGRKKAIIILGFLFTVGALGTAFAPNVELLILFRIELGIAVGGASALVPLYLSEMAPAAIRGRVAALNTVMNAIGMLSAYLVNYIYSDTGNWHYMLAWAVVPSVMLLVGMFFVPESPRWLFKHKSAAEAREVLALTRDEVALDAELEIIRQVTNQKEGTFRDLFRPGIWPIVMIGIGIAIFQQIIGTNTIFYYAPTVLAKAGAGASSAIAGSIMLGTANLAFTVIGLMIIDKLGRRKPLLIGNIIMSISLFMLGCNVMYFDASVTFLTICFALFMMGYSASWGMIAWILLAEILPLSIRGRAMGVAGVILWCANFVISFTFPILLDGIGIGPVYFLFAAIGILSFLFVRKFVPETNGKTLEEIELELTEKYAPHPQHITLPKISDTPLSLNPSQIKFESKITRIGNFALDFLQKKQSIILFGKDVPPELENMVVVHEQGEGVRSIRIGDIVLLGTQQYTISAIGETALHALCNKGHCTFVFSGEDAAELPGQIILKGIVEPRFMVGDRIQIARPQP